MNRATPGRDPAGDPLGIAFAFDVPPRARAADPATRAAIAPADHRSVDGPGALARPDREPVAADAATFDTGTRAQVPVAVHPPRRPRRHPDTAVLTAARELLAGMSWTASTAPVGRRDGCPPTSERPS